MTKLTPPPHSAAANAYERVFDGAIRLCSRLPQVATDLCAELEVGPAELTMALLLYGAQVARVQKATRTQFERAAADAFDDAPELFTVGQERQEARVPEPPPPTENGEAVIATLLQAHKLVERGWCQGDQAMKWRKAKTVPGGKELVNCLVKDPYASRWSLIGAIDAASPDERIRVQARDFAFVAVQETDFKFPPGSLVPTVLVDYNDFGMKGGVRETPEEAPSGPPRTREEVLGVLARAAAIASDVVHDVDTAPPQESEPVDPGDGIE